MIIFIGRGFFHPNLKFEDFVFGDARVSALLGYSTGTDGNEWRVEGWVDAQNGFGTTIRSEYTVKFTMTGEDTYIVDYCYVD